MKFKKIIKKFEAEKAHCDKAIADRKKAIEELDIQIQNYECIKISCEAITRELKKLQNIKKTIKHS